MKPFRTPIALVLGAAALGPVAAAASGSVRVTLGAPEVVIE